ncbi:MAG: ZIP family metal transporter [Planctomycetaceae bacterium]|nr:ZIP family metal transporter [Planctomycetaceae bacterium]
MVKHSKRIAWLLVVYSIFTVAASAFGGWLPSLMQLTHTRMQTMISFVGGLMLGIGVFHLLPHATHGLPSIDAAALCMMAGIVTMFFLIRTFQFHHHGPLEISTSREVACTHHAPDSRSHAHDHDHGHHDHVHDHVHDEVHDEVHNHDHDHAGEPHVVIEPGGGTIGGTVSHSAVVVLPTAEPHCHHAHQLSWMGIAVGLSLHTLIDGIMLAASVHAESSHPSRFSLFGLGAFLAIMLHKPLDAVSITSLMDASGWSRRSRNLVNAAFALMCPLGVLLFVAAAGALGETQQLVVSATLAFSAGVFICISLSDLLPEMEFHAHNRVELSTALAAGVLLAYAITYLETGNMHP